MNRVALGFRAHSGWAAYIGLAGPKDSPQIVARGRIELCDPRIPPPFQPYHKAAEMPFRKAVEYIRHVTEQTETFARRGIERIAAELQPQKMKVSACSVLVGSGRALGPLEKILAAHPLIHTAEGVLFRQAIFRAAEQCCPKVMGIVERELFAQAESKINLPRKEIDRRLAEFGRALGPPWQQDQKFAALAAWLAL
ncbi:MAG: hypothetical protein ACM3NO_02340 [Deltaproteobacteria bacterium]